MAWTTYAKNVPASVKAQSGVEFREADQKKAETTWEVVLRHRVDVAQNHRVVFGERNLEIVSVVPDSKDSIAMTLLCKELAS